MTQRIMKRYSGCFKRQVVEDIERGRFESIAAAQDHYGIGGATTIPRWLRQYGKNALLPKVVIVQKPNEPNEIRQLKRQVAELQRALGQTQAQNLLHEEFLKLACRELGCEVESFKKKSRYTAVHHAYAQGQVTVRRLCEMVGMTVQNYYKQRRHRQRESVDASLVLSLVSRERALQPRLGARKVLHLIGPELAAAEVSIGRDRFFALLSAHDLLIERTARSCRTTNSWHGFGVYPNLLKDAALDGPHQAWVSDITYVRTREGFVYLALVMDAWSRTIVGYDCSDSLEAVGALRALRMALSQCPAGATPIHHSDRGSQYCCDAYVRELTGSGVRISMTQENHCYENAQAERLNGILKQEYGLGGEFLTKQAAYAAVREGVWLYNNRRPHEALAYAFPMAIHSAA